MSIEQDLQRYIATEVVVGMEGQELQPDAPLLSSGLVDSLGLLQILAYIDQHYGVALLQRGSPQNFETIRALAAAIRKEARVEEVS